MCCDKSRSFGARMARAGRIIELQGTISPHRPPTTTTTWHIATNTPPHRNWSNRESAPRVPLPNMPVDLEHQNFGPGIGQNHVTYSFRGCQGLTPGTALGLHWSTVCIAPISLILDIHNLEVAKLSTYLGSVPRSLPTLLLVSTQMP